MDCYFRISDPAAEGGHGPAPRPRRPAAAPEEDPCSGSGCRPPSSSRGSRRTRARTSLRQLRASGKIRTTFVRRLISPFRRSSMFVERIRIWCCRGRRRNANVSSTQLQSFGCDSCYFKSHAAKSACAPESPDSGPADLRPDAPR